jgi:hypothetical protein
MVKDSNNDMLFGVCGLILTPCGDLLKGAYTPSYEFTRVYIRFNSFKNSKDQFSNGFT